MITTIKPDTTVCPGCGGWHLLGAQRCLRCGWRLDMHLFCSWLRDQRRRKGNGNRSTRNGK